MIVLDTNIISEIMRPEPDANVMSWLRQQRLNTLAITAVNIAEIRYGIGRLPDGQRRLNLDERFRAFLSRGFDDRILAFDASAAEVYSTIVVEREKVGRPIDAFDAMIAAIARVNGANVATRDISGFEGCGVDLINPWNKKQVEQDDA